MLAAAVRAAADLDVRAVGRGNQIGPRAQVFLEQAPQAARLRDRQPARLGAGTAGDIGHVRRLGQPEAGRAKPPIEIVQVADRDPAEHQILIDGDADRAVACRPRDSSASTRICSLVRVAERHVAVAIT